jgi:drug/metabolite transporter (DMT)-like permease
VEAALFVVLAAGTAPNAAAMTTPWISGPWLGFTAVLAVVCTYGAFSLMNAWQPKITPTEAGLIYCIEPLFASIFALIVPQVLSACASISYPNERVTWSLFIGGGLIILANILVLTNSTEAGNAG